eukprot:TRINITY_DN22202_c0_g1_i1.p1 TRINITY_DN22202_c0_g1~~TRINITY_DN22202_c0_g1_i1.p1  ORF type:complete len:228 (-),score=25.62 TRINITY_DN22202_c0_g1_i1:327-1010(-)
MGQPFYYSDDEDTGSKNSNRRGPETSTVPTVSADLGRNLIAGNGLMYDFGGAQNHLGDQYVEVGDTNSESSEEGAFRRVQNRSERQQNAGNPQNNNSSSNNNNNSSAVIQVTPALRRAQEVGESRLQMRLSSLWRHNTAAREAANERFRRDRMPGPYARIPRHHNYQRGIVRGRFQETANQQQQQQLQTSGDGQPTQQPTQSQHTQSGSPSSFRRQRRRFGFIIPQS